MRTIYKNILLATFALYATGCSQDENLMTSIPCELEAVHITAQVSTSDIIGGFTRSNPIGTANEQVSFNTNDKIAVSAETQTAIIYTYNGTGLWTPETGKNLKWETNKMTFTAYYPVTEGVDTRNFTPSYGTTASLTELQANDYMTFNGEKEKGDDNSVSIEMSRKMTRFVIDDIKYNSQYEATNNAVTSIAITSGSSKYENGNWDKTNVTAQMFQQEGKWYAILPPTTTAESEQIFLSITLRTNEILVVKGIPATEAGNSYSYTLSIGKNMVTIDRIKVNPWTNEIITGGIAKEVTKELPMGDKTAEQAVKGDFAMKDGTFISKEINLSDEQKKNVAGIVFWTIENSNTTGNTPAKLTDDVIMATDFPKCTHGLIVSTKDIATSTKWQSSYSSIADYQTNVFMAENKTSYKPIASNEGETDPINYILGYQNTKLLRAYNSQCEDLNKVLPISLLSEWEIDNPAPINTTGWFIPSLKELTLLCGIDTDDVNKDNFGEDTWNTMNNILGSNYSDKLWEGVYYSSTESSSGSVFGLYFSWGKTYGNINKQSANYVRAICAY